MRGVSPVPREGVGNLPPAAARRLYPTLRFLSGAESFENNRWQKVVFVNDFLVVVV